MTVFLFAMHLPLMGGWNTLLHVGIYFLYFLTSPKWMEWSLWSVVVHFTLTCRNIQQGLASSSLYSLRKEIVQGMNIWQIGSICRVLWGFTSIHRLVNTWKVSYESELTLEWSEIKDEGENTDSSYPSSQRLLTLPQWICQLWYFFNRFK